MATRLYCRDCCETNRVPPDHKDHKICNLDAIDQEVRTELITLTQKLQDAVDRFKKMSKSLNACRCSLTVASQTTSEEVDKRVATICREVKKLGESMKNEIIKMREQHIQEVTETKMDTDSEIQLLESTVRISNDIIKDNSTLSLLDILPVVRESVDRCSDEFCSLPVSDHLVLRFGDIDLDSLKEAIGELEAKKSSTFVTSFHVNECMSDTFYYSNDYNSTGLDNLHWCVGVRHNELMFSLCVSLKLKKRGEKDTQACRASYTLTLVNRLEDAKSFVKEAEGVLFRPGDDYSLCCLNVDWNQLFDSTNGFLLNDKFEVVTTIAINELME
ncbi:hypothetical protein SNE40_002298 [Patella caerulea]|uniref:MATH domain-containing protein n=1 Tax=Patella caerulea TaxID=87958 RepID=A0AAN8K5J6_PATCE